ncbi:MAG: dihydrolipoamide acetyltransferase family protein [Pseudomonadota bacterium]
MSEHIFTLPDLGEGTVEAEVSEWHVNVGDLVKEDQPVVDMLTDKAAVEVPAPVTGTIVKLGGEPGDIIAVGAPLVVFETDASVNVNAAPSAASDKPRSASTPAPAAQATPSETPNAEPSRATVATAPIAPPAPLPAVNLTASTPAPAPAGIPKSVTTAKVLTSPVIRRLAREHRIDLAEIEGTGSRGRILRADFDAHLVKLERGPAPIPPRKRVGAKEVKVIGMRRIIAQRMSASKSEIPHFSYVEEIDVTELEQFRQLLNQQYAQYGVKFSYLPLLVQCVAKALARFPQCNALYDKERNVLVQHDPVHAGIATQTPDGLKVPVVHHAEAMSLPQLAQAIASAAQGARDGSASKHQLTGSTITVTSLGKLGGIASTPVINQPEVSIIGVNRAVERPMVVNGGIHIRRMMNLSASFDHRFVDGYDAAEFIQAIKEMLENPSHTFSAG